MSGSAFVFLPNGNILLKPVHSCTAQNELAGEGVGICDDLITLEIMSPDVCDLTLIDLPGIARVPVKGQPEDIGLQVSLNCDLTHFFFATIIFKSFYKLNIKAGLGFFQKLL